MLALIAEIRFSVLSLCAFLQAAHVRVIVRLSFDYMIISCKSRGTILQVLFPLVKEWISFGIFRLLDGMDVNPVLLFVPIARLCEADWSVLKV